MNFNPRSHEGSDAVGADIEAIEKVFQSTLPRGERRYPQAISYYKASDFNPRSHEGSDSIILSAGLNCLNFNPRSHEGSDFLSSLNFSLLHISIHAPTRGAT